MATTAVEGRLLIDGDWVETGEWIEVRSPYDQSLIGRVAKAGAGDARRALDAAEKAMRDPLPAHERATRVAGSCLRDASDQRLVIRRTDLDPLARLDPLAPY